MLGFDGKIYYNTGTSETPTWTEVNILKDAKMGFSFGEALAATRESRVTGVAKTMLSIEIPFMLRVIPGNTAFEAVKDLAFSADTADEFLILTGDKAVDDNFGVKGSFQVFPGELDQNNEGIQFLAITLKPDLDDIANFKFAEVASSALAYTTPWA